MIKYKSMIPTQAQVPTAKRQKEENRGGFFGGIAYLGEKVASGFMQGVEGVWDFAAGGIADLVGADDWAERQVSNDWFGDWYENSGEWFNPGSGWRVAGDVASGIGTSLPTALAATGITIATGGLGGGAAAGFLVGGASAGGNAVKDAYRKTGKLGKEEWGYGALVGATEGAIEAVTNVIGVGTGALTKAASNIGRKAATEVAETAAKEAAKSGMSKILGSAVKHVGKNFISEAAEEGIAEFVAPYYARITYDPSAKNATMEEIMYASFVGGLSGVIFGAASPGVSAGVNAYTNTRAGKAAIDGGRSAEILETAKRIAEAEAKEPSGYTLFDKIRKDYEYIQKNGGEVNTAATVRRLGELEKLTSATSFLPAVEESAAKILNNPADAAELYSTMGVKDENGNLMEITPEKLVEGIDLVELSKGVSTRKEAKAQRQALRRAISSNRLLLALAVADATGSMMLDAESFAKIAATGGYIRRGDYQNFLETATPEQKAAMAERLGIAGGLDAVSFEDYASAVNRYAATPDGGAYIEAVREAQRNAGETASIENESDKQKLSGESGGDNTFSYEHSSQDTKKRRILVGMTESERASVLREQKISPKEIKVDEASLNWDDLQNNRKKEVGKLLVRKMRDLGHLRSYKTDAIDVEFEFTGGGLRKSMNSQVEDYGGTLADLAKVVMNMQTLLDSSVLIEIHKDKAKGTPKENQRLVQTYVLLSAYAEGKNITPVQFEVKQYVDDQNRLYLAVALTKIEADVMGDTVLHGEERTRLLPTSTYSIPQLVEKINPRDENFFKYIPDEFLSAAQKVAKERALAREAKKYGKDAHAALSEDVAASTAKSVAGEKQTGTTLRELDAWAKENVKKYNELLPNEKREIRATIRQARALGIPEADVRRYANLSARARIRVSFSKERCYAGMKDGAKIYADGFYDPKSNEIVVNPEGKRSAARLILHELSHALYSGKYAQALDKAVKHMDEERGKEVAERYSGFGAEVISEEIAVHHAEDVLGNERNLERLLRDEPTIGEKILSFFGLAKTEYAGNPRLTRAAGRLYRHFEAALGAFSEANRGNLAADPLTRINSENMQVSADGRRDAIVALEDGKVYVEASRRIITGTTKSEQRKQITDFFSRLLKNKPSIDIHTIEGDVLTISKDETAQKARDDHKTVAGKRVEMSADEFLVKLHVESHIDEITEISKKRGKGKADDKGHSFVDNGFTYRTAYFKDFDGQYYEVTLSIGHKGTVATVYNVGKIEEGVSPTAKIIAVAESQLLLETPSDTSISDSSEKINPSGEKNSSNRAALPSEPYTSATSEHVGKERPRYEPSRKERFFTMKDRAYIETVDEMYGAVKYLRKVGGLSKAEAEVAAQMARSTMNQAQAMIGSVQYNVFSEKPERMGDGLLEIYKPVKKWSAEKQNDFELFLLHRLNIDRMTLEQRSRAWAAPLRNAVQTLEGEVQALSEELNTLRAELQSGNTAIDRARIRRGIVKTDAAKVRWQERIDAITSDIFGINQRINEAEKALSAKETALKRAQADYDAAIIPNKPVFGKDETIDENGNMRRDHDVTAAESRAFIDSLKKKYGADFSTFEATADKLYGYLDNLQTMRVTAELISQERADRMKKLYPHYVPAYRVKNGSGVAPVKGKNAMEVATTVRRAKGGNADIVAVEQSIAEQTMELMKAGQINRLAGKIYEAAKASGDTTYVEILEESTEPMPNGEKPESVHFDFDVTQEDIKAYVEKAYAKENDQDYRPYARIGDRLLKETESQIDLTGYVHALRDNDIRHIRNSHGEGTNEKYPITQEDLAKIPYIVENYDKIFVKTNSKGNPGIVYVKVGANNVTYYVEAVTREYHNQKLLVNKQMIKVGADEIPNLYGLEKAINKKESSSQYLADLKEIRKAYVQDVKENCSTTSISDSSEKINPLEENSEGRYVGMEEMLRPKEGQLTFYRDGKRVTMKVSKELLLAFEGVRNPTLDFSNPIARATARLNSLFKRGVTSLNPAFMLRNPIRDLQDAGLNSRHPAQFAKFYASGFAAKEMLSNSKDWQLYRALGGFASSVFEDGIKDVSGYAGFESIVGVFEESRGDAKKLWKALKTAPAAVKSFFAGVSNVNAFLEQVTRFAEFKASLAAGDSPSVAVNNSAEVTTNFGRRGRTTKWLNATVMPFLNPAVQGFDKIFRNVSDVFSGDKTGRQIASGMASLITKAFIVGMIPMIFNQLMYDDDEDYKKLREEDKENYFLVKRGEGTFIKIPRGRLAAVIGGLYNRGSKIAKGEDPDIAGYLKNVKTNVTPVDNITRTIFSPIFDVKNNKTWYGGEIEGREFDDTAPRDRYDESTSSIAVALGRVFNYSPKKIHYLLDQYSGAIGDFVLPATSQKEHKDFFSGNFTIDSVTNNKLSEEFYKVYDETRYADTAGDEAAAYRLKYLNRVKKSVSEMNKEIDAIRASDLSNAEKAQQVRVARSLINAAYDSAVKSVDAVDAAIEKTKGIEDEALRSAEITRIVFGSESAILQHNKKAYEKLSLFHKAGIGYDELYAFYFSTLGVESDTDKSGNVIEGSRRKKIVDSINTLNVSTLQKILLLLSKGYTLKDGDFRGVTSKAGKNMILRYLSASKDLTKAEKEQLAVACGFVVKNGKIVLK